MGLVRISSFIFCLVVFNFRESSSSTFLSSSAIWILGLPNHFVLQLFWFHVDGLGLVEFFCQRFLLLLDSAGVHRNIRESNIEFSCPNKIVGIPGVVLGLKRYTYKKVRENFLKNS